MFSDANFLKAIDQNFVLVSLDYPRTDEVKAKVPNPKRNEEISKKYEIRGFPTVLLMTADGEVFGQTGYQPGGPTPYLKSVDEMRTKGKKTIDEAKTFASQYAEAKGDAKSKLLDDAIDRLAKLDAESPAIAKYSTIVKEAFTLDPDNKAGRKLRACKALMTAGQLDADIEKAVQSLDAKNEAGLLERLVDARCGAIDSLDKVKSIAKEIEDLDALGIKDKDIKLRLYANVAFWNSREDILNDKVKAKQWAERLKAFAGDDKRVKDLLDQILGG